MISKLSDKESHFNINESDLIFNAMLDKKLNFSENTGLLLTFILHSDFSEITLKKILENIDITKIIVYQKDLFNILNLELNQFPQSHRMLILNKLSLSSIIDPEKDYFKELFSLPAEQLTPVLCRLAFDKIISLRYTSLNLLSYLLTFNAEKLSDEARVKIWGRLKAELSTLINRFSDLEILLSLNKDQLPDEKRSFIWDALKEKNFKLTANCNFISRHLFTLDKNLFPTRKIFSTWFGKISARTASVFNSDSDSIAHKKF